MKTLAISGLPVSVVFYTETGRQDPQIYSPKQRISRNTADTNAKNWTDATFNQVNGILFHHLAEGTARNPQALNSLFRRARHPFHNIVLTAPCRQSQAGRISQARPALTPV